MLEHIQIQFIHLTRPGGTTEMERSGMTLHFCLLYCYIVMRTILVLRFDWA